MRVAHPRRLLAAALTVALGGLSGAFADARQAPSFEHLRPVDDLAREFLHEAWHGSETVRALVAILEVSDVFVQIETQSQEAFRGRLRFMSGSPVCRWVRVTLRLPGRKPDLLAALAHELQHAVELAEAPEAGDRESVEALFHRIGFRRDELDFETDAALAVEARVRRELAQNGVR